MITAAVLLIGDELLAGDVQDANLKYIAVRLQEKGILLKECRVVSDVISEIVDALNALRHKYTYVFTTGGIGSTHDDVTTESVAKAFNVPIEMNTKALGMLEGYYGKNMNSARKRLALMPKDAIVHPEMGFQIDNVYVLAGIPSIMQKMFEVILSSLEHGKPIYSFIIQAFVLENDIADDLRAFQEKWPQVNIGSYPFCKEGQWGTKLIVRSESKEILEKVRPLLEKLILI